MGDVYSHYTWDNVCFAVAAPSSGTKGVLQQIRGLILPLFTIYSHALPSSRRFIHQSSLM